MSGYQWQTPAAPAAIALLHCDPCPGLVAAQPRGDRLRFTTLLTAAGVVVDEIVIGMLPDGRWEIGCHGGPGIRAAIDEALAGFGLGQVDETTDASWDRLSRAASPAAVAWLLGGQEPTFREVYLFRPPIVLITGPANAGKSSLLNAWCGHRRALVSDVPGTTRDLVAAEALCGGWRLRLLDSAGLRAGAAGVEAAGQELVAEARSWVDAVIHMRSVGDQTHPPEPGDLAVISKIDLVDQAPAGLTWTAPDHGGATRAETLLDELSTAVLERLGLPILP